MADTRLGLYVGLASLALLHYYWRSVRGPKLHRPPSPASLPLVGNLFSIPPGHEHLVFAKLAEQLKSDIISLEILGQNIIILRSAEDATELLEKRSALYSDRPTIPMVADPSLMNWSRLPSVIGYNDIWRHYRRIMNNWLNMRAVNQFNDLQERQARVLLQRLLGATKQERPFEHVKNEILFVMASTMFQLAYGYKLRGHQDPIFQEAKLALHRLLDASMQTNFFVNVLPALSYIPEGFPGAGWKRTGREWGAQQEKSKTEPYEWLKAQVAGGTQEPSLLGSLLPDHKLLLGLSPAERDDRLKEVGIILFQAGTDTESDLLHQIYWRHPEDRGSIQSANFLVNLVAALVSNPHVQARAQQELDSVLGHAVLPKISDMERLPYIKNLIDEVLRVYPIVPLAVPHTCFQDDVYKGYNIQKGTVILGNVWSMSRDPRHYKDPEVFNPDRFLDPDVPRAPVFGWGRRKCPGVYFAEASAFIATASLLATYTFSRKTDEAGREIMPRIEHESNSLVVEIKPFEFEIKPRSDEHRQLIVGAVDE